jgi:hypothetical protein
VDDFTSIEKENVAIPNHKMKNATNYQKASPVPTNSGNILKHCPSPKGGIIYAILWNLLKNWKPSIRSPYGLHMDFI